MSQMSKIKKRMNRWRRRTRLHHQARPHTPPRLEQLEDRTLLSLLGIAPDLPLIFYNNTGSIDYDASEQAMVVDGDPLIFRESASSPNALFSPGGEVSLQARVDNAGNLLGGVPGDDFVVTGDLDLDGNGTIDASGTLLSGEIVGFGFLETGATDTFDFQIEPTGGALLPFWNGQDIGVTLSSENSTFNDSFANDFSGGAKGNIVPTGPGTIPLPAQLGDFVWHDQNVNGLQDDGDTGFNGVTVNLFEDADGDGIAEPGGDDGGPIASTVTADNPDTGEAGFYLFEGLEPGNYFTEVDDANFNAGAPLENFFPTLRNQGGDDAVDSDGQRTGDVTSDTTTLASGGEDLTLDFGFFTTGVDVEKTGTPTIIPGQSITYDFVITNTGDVPLDVSTIDLLLDDSGNSIFDGVVNPGDSATFSRTFTPDLSTTTTTGEIDFETDSFGAGLNAGDIITNQFANAGITISSDSAAHPVMVFDTANPTGGDLDLGTANSDFGGPGIGNAGGIGMPGENSVDRGKVLILSEDGDSSDPDDNARGGTMTFEFDEPVDINTVGVIDMDSNEGQSRVVTTDVNGNQQTVFVEELGENSFQALQIFDEDVVRMDIIFTGSGAVSEVTFAEQTPSKITNEVTVFGVPVDPEGLTLPTVDDFGMAMTDINRDANPALDLEKRVGIETGGAGTEGKTPGFWRQPQHFDDWVGFEPGDSFEAVFGVDATGDPTLLDAVTAGGGGEFALQRHATAALLNAMNPNVDYAFTANQVVTAVQQAYATDSFEPVKNQFEAENEKEADLSTPAASTGSYFFFDADEPTSQLVPDFPAGLPIQFQFIVTNTGDAAFNASDIILVDDNGTPGDASDDFSPTFNSSSDAGGDLVLSVGESWTYFASSVTQDLGGTVAPGGVDATFDLTGSSPLDGPNGNTRVFSDNGVTVEAAAFSRSDAGDWDSVFLGAFGSGLGVTDNTEGNGGGGTHRTDNVGETNYVMFRFSQDVVVDRALLDSVVHDSDITVWIGSVNDPNAPLDDALLNSLELKEDNWTSSSHARWADINHGEVAGNVLVLAASTADATPEDYFKIRKLDVTTVESQGGVFQNTVHVQALGIGDEDSATYVNTGDTPQAPPAFFDITGTKVRDLTGNGLTSDDTGLGGVEIKLFEDVNGDGKLNDGGPIATTTTEADGAYTFNDLAAGTYFVKENVGHGFVQTFPFSGEYHTVEITNTDVTGVDFANFKQICDCDITDVSYLIDGDHKVDDLSGNVDAGDTVEVTFTVQGDPMVVTLVSYAEPEAGGVLDDQFIFNVDSEKFAAGTHSLEVFVPNSNFQIDFVKGPAIDQLRSGTNVTYSSQNRLIDADRSSGGHVLENAGSLAGLVYHDANNNGVQDDGELGIGGAEVTVENEHTGDQFTRVTKSDGSYLFGNLEAGEYTLTQTQPSGFADGQDAVGTLGGTLGNDTVSDILVAASASGVGYNFGEVTATGGTGAYLANNGTVVIDAADYDDSTSKRGKAWEQAHRWGETGKGSMTTDDHGVNNNRNYIDDSPMLSYEVKFDQTGTYYVFIRGIGNSGNDDSVHVGLNGQEVETADRISGFGHGWDWSNDTMDGSVARIQVDSPGVHTVNVWMREDGFVFDKMVLSTDRHFNVWSEPEVSERDIAAAGQQAAAPAWDSTDVGNVGKTGSVSIDDSTGLITMEGGGHDIWGNHDAFNFTHQTLIGDGEITARVLGVERTDAWSKAGVMIRETLDADSKHAMMVLTGDRGSAFQHRNHTGHGSHHDGDHGRGELWVKLVREGNKLTGYQSNDGHNWEKTGQTWIDMNEEVYIGLAVTAHNNGKLATAQFDHVEIEGNVVSDANAPLQMASNVESTVMTEFDDDHVTIDHTSEMNLDNGTVVLEFSTEDTDERQGLFSKDSRGHDDGGHLTIYVDNDRVYVRMQSENRSYTIKSDMKIKDDQRYHLAFTFGDEGMRLYLDGQEVASHWYHAGLNGWWGDGNEEPIVLGASATHSSDGDDNRLRDHLEGELGGVGMIDRALSAAEVQALFAGSLNTSSLNYVMKWNG